LLLILESSKLTVASAHAGVANLHNQTGELKKAIPSRAFLNAINEYKSAEGAMDKYAGVDTEPEGSAEESDGSAEESDGSTEVPGDGDMDMEDEQVHNGEFGMGSDDDSEGERAEELDDD
jgi:hypothetical protein